jgi:hypothetical protein
LTAYSNIPIDYKDHTTQVAFQSTDQSPHNFHLRKVRLINPTSIIASQNIRDSERGANLSREARARPRSSRPRVPVLLERNVPNPLISRVPDLPPSAVNDIRQRRVLEADARVLAPWTAEVDVTGGWSAARVGRDVGLVDHVVGDVGVGGAAGGGHVAVAVDADVGPVDPGDAVLAEDEVGRALDEALAEEVLAHVGEEGVLVAVESDAVVALLCAVAAQSDGLGAYAVGVLDVDVVELSVVGVVGDCGWGRLACLTLGKRRHVGTYQCHHCWCRS